MQPEFEKPPGGEKEPVARPRIYVASLSDYNAGRLHGVWLDADQAPHDLDGGVTEMLERSPTGFAEEWAIHDFEGFGKLSLPEFVSLSTVSRLAQGIVEHGLAFGAWAEQIGLEEIVLEKFEEAFMGEWESVSAYAAELLDDYGLEAAIDSVVPDCLRAYVRVDAEGLGRDLLLGGDLMAVGAPSGSVWIFQGGVA